MNKRYAFHFDAEKCIGCRGCAMACKNFNRLIPEMTWRYVYPLAEEIYPHRDRAFYSWACNHCEHPTCLEVCPTGAYSKRPDGIVVHDQPTCIGCHNCIRSCPYGAPRFATDELRGDNGAAISERTQAWCDGKSVAEALALTETPHPLTAEQTAKLARMRSAYEELTEAYEAMRRMVERGYLTLGA